MLPSLKATIQAYGLAAKKSLGQHFLLDESIMRQIVAYAGELSGVHAIEIGPGPGGLTRALLERNPASLTAVEMDSRCVAALNTQLGNHIRLIEADAMRIDLPALVPAPRKIIANLPYNVGTPLLIRWLHELHRLGAPTYASLTLMFQKEVAERIVAAPGGKDYGRLSVLAQWLCECRYDMELPPHAFSPPPKVDSAVVTLIPRTQPIVEVSLETLELVVGKAFGQRRKMLRGALKGLAVEPELLLSEAGIDGTARAEQLDVATLCNLARVYEKQIKR